ncbi:MAG TPA: endonuclease/exonuclease/phosphatase family protein [Solimonas sp.]|nr:endonuclease/exonuclease/phosphatase family protein [Solimonas sp.]
MSQDTPAPLPDAQPPLLRVLSLNIQVGLRSSGYHHYLTNAWKHLLPSPGVRANLDRIAELASAYDVVALQEADAGSLRTQALNQVEYLAKRGGFEHWHAAVNRDLGPFARHCLGCLSRVPLRLVRHHPLPGWMRGRGALELDLLPAQGAPLRLIVTHLALSRSTRTHQLNYLAGLMQQHPRSLLVGDLNCEPQELLAHGALGACGLRSLHELPTYPSWKPTRSIDHVLAGSGLRVRRAHVLAERYSDHLPVVTEIALDVESP